MSIAVLNEVYQETRRLAVAGSVVAPGDFRLQKLIAPLEKAGQKAPVFKRVAECVSAVVESNERTASAALLELASVITAILYTQGSTGIEGKKEDLPESQIRSTRTTIPARFLKPLLEALTVGGQGRMQQVRDAFEMNMFHDLRLVRPALSAIDDSHHEMADFIVEKVLPLYGTAIIPELRENWDIKGKAPHARRLRLMHQLDAAGTRPLIQQALEEGSKEVKIAAIRCLGDADEDRDYLLEQSSSKNKEVRQAALLALARDASPKALEVLIKNLDTKDLELVTIVGREYSLPALQKEADQRFDTGFQELLSLKEKAKQAVLVRTLIQWLDIVMHGQDSAALKRAEMVLKQSETLLKIKSSPGGESLLDELVSHLTRFKSGVELLIQYRDQVPVSEFYQVFHAARQHLKPAKLFDLFSVYVDTKAKKGTPEFHRHTAIASELEDLQNPYFWYARYAVREHSTPDIDPRWIDLAIDQDLESAVYGIASKPTKKLHSYLDQKWEKQSKLKKNQSELYPVLRAMLDCQHPKAVQRLLSTVEAEIQSKSTSYRDYFLLSLCHTLTPESIPELERFLTFPKLTERRSDLLVEAIQAIQEAHKKGKA